MFGWVQAMGHITELTSNKRIKENVPVLTVQDEKGSNGQR